VAKTIPLTMLSIHSIFVYLHRFPHLLFLVVLLVPMQGAVIEILQEYHKGGITEQDCLTCTSS